jgi:hypothetical protein
MTDAAVLPRFSLRSTITFYESATISETALRELQDREAQKRRARHLQESAA